jgi:biofilm PGA synthesis N-glycosyltransferase PgaC
MISPIVPLAIILTGIIAAVYLTYLYVSHAVKEEEFECLNRYPSISIVFPAYNEERVIESRIKSLAQCDYPGGLELIIVNDSSEDRTEEIALTTMKKYGLSGRVIKNETRSGVNFSMSRGIKEAKNELIVCTDADVYFDKDALKRVVSKLISQKDIGAVTGDLQPFVGTEVTKKSESAYRSVYGNICKWESNVASTYCFNGALYAIRKGAPSTLDIKDGAYDAGIAFSVIRNGYRALYVSSAKVFENVPDDLSAQFRQKIRRAARLIKATWINRDMISGKHGKFGRLVLPLRFTTFLVVPVAFFMSVSFWIYIFSIIDIRFLPFLVIAFLLAAISGAWRSNLVSTFILHQLYLFLGLFNTFRDVHIWKLTERKRIEE